MYSNYDDIYGQGYRSVANTYMPRPTAISEEIISLNDAVELIKQSVGNEKEDEMFYDSIIKLAPTTKDKEIITSIRDDERKHNQILRYVYYKITGMMLPNGSVGNVQDINNFETESQINQYGNVQRVSSSVQTNQRINNNSMNSSMNNPMNNTMNNQMNSSMNNSMNNTIKYKSNLEKALFGELDAVKKYRKIMGAMPDNETYTLIMSIMTDELRHADKYNFLLSK